jgi:hypothetical protein
MVIIPILAVVVSRLPKKEINSNVITGIYADEYDSYISDIADSLTSSEEGFVFEKCQSLEDLENKVATGAYDCGYYFPDNFSDNFSTDIESSSMYVYTSPSSMFKTVTSEMVFNQILKAYSPVIMTDYLKNNQYTGNLYDEAYDKYINEKYTEYMNSQKIFKLDTNYTGDYAAGSYSINTFPFKKIVGLIIFLSGLFGMLNYLKDENRHVYNMISQKERFSFCIMNVLANMLPTVIISYVTLLIYGNDTTSLKLAGHLLIYMLICLVWTLCYRIIFRSYKSFISGIPVTIICTLVFSPVFIDLTKYLYVLKLLSYIFPTTYF